MVQPFWDRVWWFLIELNILLPYDLAIVLLGIYPKEWKTYVLTKTCTWMFIVTLLIISKTWKQPRCSLVGEWINKLWYIQTTELYLLIKRNEQSSHKKTWMNLKHIISKWKKPTWNGDIWHNSNYMTFWIRQIYGYSTMSSSFYRLGAWGGMNR